MLSPDEAGQPATDSPLEEELTKVSTETSSDAENLNYIADKVANRQCILFLGSAIHAPSTNPRYQYSKAESPPIGSELSEHLALKGTYPDGDYWNLQRVSQHYESKFKSRFRLVEEIESVVHRGRKPSPVLRALAKLNFPLVITTNYDQLYETALGKRSEEYTVSIYSPSSKKETRDCQAKPDPNHPYILKIHGDISVPGSIVITDEDYIHFVLRMGDTEPYHPVGPNVLTYLGKWPTLFIGYSLRDYNFRVLFRTIRWQLDPGQIPPNYAVDHEPDELIRDVYETQRRHVTFIVEDVWKFVPKLYQAVTKEEMPQ